MGKVVIQGKGVGDTAAVHQFEAGAVDPVPFLAGETLAALPAGLQQFTVHIHNFKTWTVLPGADGAQGGRLVEPLGEKRKLASNLAR